ncbi:MAG: HNH endonuclease family protein, partial [Sporichthyaceae bacterium]|nr:HNH endonuclease family protein [Sporichthyaceae bacterium]
MGSPTRARTVLTRVLVVAGLTVAAVIWVQQLGPGEGSDQGLSSDPGSGPSAAPPAGPADRPPGAGQAQPPQPIAPALADPEQARQARTALATIKVAAPSNWDSYRRDAFGRFWSDEVDTPGGRNGCDTRDDVLRRDLADRRMGTRNPCVVLSGTLHDPYTGKIIEYDRSRASGIEIDHIVALGTAWRSGAYAWTDQQRLAFANDITNLAAVDRVANQDKRSLTPDRWKPPRTASWCGYASRYVLTKAKYQLTVT